MPSLERSQNGLSLMHGGVLAHGGVLVQGGVLMHGGVLVLDLAVRQIRVYGQI